MGPKCLRDQRATMDFLGSPLPMHCPETTFGPDKREIWLAAWAAAAWLSAATSGSLTVASEISTSTCSPALPASEENWCLEGRPPPGGTIDLSKPSSNAQALKSTKSFSSEVLVTLEVPCPVWLWCLLEGPATIVSLSCVQDLPRRLTAFLTQTGLILLPS